MVRMIMVMMIMVRMIMVRMIMVMVIIVMMIMVRMILVIMMALMTTMLRISKIMMMAMIKMMLRMLTTMIAPTIVVQSVHVLAEAKATKAETVRIRVLIFLKILKSRKEERWKWMDTSLVEDSVIVGHKTAGQGRNRVYQKS